MWFHVGPPGRTSIARGRTVARCSGLADPSERRLLLIGGSFERCVVVGAVGLDDRALPWPAQVGHDAPAVEATAH